MKARTLNPTHKFDLYALIGKSLNSLGWDEDIIVIKPRKF